MANTSNSSQSVNTNLGYFIMKTLTSTNSHASESARYLKDLRDCVRGHGVKEVFDNALTKVQPKNMSFSAKIHSPEFTSFLDTFFSSSFVDYQPMDRKVFNVIYSCFHCNKLFYSPITLFYHAIQFKLINPAQPKSILDILFGHILRVPYLYSDTPTDFNRGESIMWMMMSTYFMCGIGSGWKNATQLDHVITSDCTHIHQCVHYLAKSPYDGLEPTWKESAPDLYPLHVIRFIILKNIWSKGMNMCTICKSPFTVPQSIIKHCLIEHQALLIARLQLILASSYSGDIIKLPLSCTEVRTTTWDSIATQHRLMILAQRQRSILGLLTPVEKQCFLLIKPVFNFLFPKPTRCGCSKINRVFNFLDSAAFWMYFKLHLQTDHHTMMDKISCSRCKFSSCGIKTIILHILSMHTNEFGVMAKAVASKSEINVDYVAEVIARICYVSFTDIVPEKNNATGTGAKNSTTSKPTQVIPSNQLIRNNINTMYKSSAGDKSSKGKVSSGAKPSSVYPPTLLTEEQIEHMIIREDVLSTVGLMVETVASGLEGNPPEIQRNLPPWISSLTNPWLQETNPSFSGDRPSVFVCDICSSIFYFRDLQAQHMRTFHPAVDDGEPVKEFSNSTEAEAYLASRPTNRNNNIIAYPVTTIAYKCSLCSATFVNSDDRRYLSHIRKCGRAFGSINEELRWRKSMVVAQSPCPRIAQACGSTASSPGQPSPTPAPAQLAVTDGNPTIDVYEFDESDSRVSSGDSSSGHPENSFSDISDVVSDNPDQLGSPFADLKRYLVRVYSGEAIDDDDEKWKATTATKAKPSETAQDSNDDDAQNESQHSTRKGVGGKGEFRVLLVDEELAEVVPPSSMESSREERSVVDDDETTAAHHGDTRLRCQICEEYFDSSIELQVHIKYCGASISLFGDKTATSNVTTTKSGRRARNVTGGTTTCEQCDREFKYYQRFLTHVCVGKSVHGNHGNQRGGGSHSSHAVSLQCEYCHNKSDSKKRLVCHLAKCAARLKLIDEDELMSHEDQLNKLRKQSDFSTVVFTGGSRSGYIDDHGLPTKRPRHVSPTRKRREKLDSAILDLYADKLMLPKQEPMEDRSVFDTFNAWDAQLGLDFARTAVKKEDAGGEAVPPMSTDECFGECSACGKRLRTEKRWRKHAKKCRKRMLTAEPSAPLTTTIQVIHTTPSEPPTSLPVVQPDPGVQGSTSDASVVVPEGFEFWACPYCSLSFAVRDLQPDDHVPYCDGSVPAATTNDEVIDPAVTTVSAQPQIVIFADTTKEHMIPVSDSSSLTTTATVSQHDSIFDALQDDLETAA